jgi:Domain of unknown function (DUF4263)
VKREYINPDAFASMLDRATGERELLRFFAKHPHAIYWTLCRAGGHGRYVFREFPLGSSHVADFVLLNSYSGVWEIKFVELEPVSAKVFKAGVPAKRFAGAIKQIDDWVTYFERHREQVRADLLRWARTRDLLGYTEREAPSNFSGNLLADPATHLAVSSHVFIGRRSVLSAEEHSQKARYLSRHTVEVATYDRILDLVRDRYKDAEDWLSEA